MVNLCLNKWSKIYSTKAYVWKYIRRNHMANHMCFKVNKVQGQKHKVWERPSVIRTHHTFDRTLNRDGFWPDIDSGGGREVSLSLSRSGRIRRAAALLVGVWRDGFGRVCRREAVGSERCLCGTLWKVRSPYQARHLLMCLCERFAEATWSRTVHIGSLTDNS
jgi:hypothetical protein